MDESACDCNSNDDLGFTVVRDDFGCDLVSEVKACRGGDSNRRGAFVL